MYRRLNTDQRGLWEETLYKVKAAYNKVPEVKTEAVYRAVSVPSYNLVPVVEVAGDGHRHPGAAGAGEDPGSVQADGGV